MRMRAMNFSLDHTVRFQLTRQNHSSCDALEQKFKNLDVPSGFVEVAAPSIEAMAANQVAILQRLSRVVDAFADLLGERRDVLRIVEDVDPGRGVVRGNSLQAFEH